MMATMMTVSQLFLDVFSRLSAGHERLCNECHRLPSYFSGRARRERPLDGNESMEASPLGFGQTVSQLALVY